MSAPLPPDLPHDPKLAANIVHFARALRRAGLPVGPGRTLEAIRAVALTGLSDRRDFYWTLHACLVSRPEETRVFAQLFRLFWRDPRYMEQMMSMLLPSVRGLAEERPPAPAERRAAEALTADAPRPPAPRAEDEALRLDARLTASGRDRLRHLDFEQMSPEESAEARRMLARLRLPVPPVAGRRQAPARHGRPDPRRTLRQAMRQGGELRALALKAPRPRAPDLVVLCDISGSMSLYSRMVLHFLHALSNRAQPRGAGGGTGWGRVHAFTFGTRLTDISRLLRTRDVDAALAAAGARAGDWEGGTRIGDCLAAFNRDWSRRVLSQGAVVLLITDGLDRGDPELLVGAAQRLQRSCRQLIWLNPLLRFDGFAPKARGVAALLPHVDSFRAAHNVASLEALAEAISKPDDPGEKARLMCLLRE
ncbi:VWA domain-containing protein [Pseudooceanicola sp. CBS1P-1]|uniref:VWA domain-containing protein n=1 Tax=Pseudooceanicola albus TaxID=2692189 RepID=A0A6L7G0J6_9RHOB|nr:MULTISPECIES: VWA domain-containing protein [Pseudooceanicola]MBT9382477.1 VWA domain-containing protein [Pseudooceanicola endophyticus]MXN17018.1 VWA domain-containing protein [Pseudooceanicola albus]